MSIKILHGDARESTKDIDTGSIALVYLDPPFNTGKEYRLDTETDLGFDDIFSTDQEYTKLIEPVLLESKRVLKEGGSLFFHISAEKMLLPHALCAKYFKKVQPIFWNRSRSKNNTKNKLGSVVDVILWCSDSKKPKYNMVYQPLDSYYSENSYKNQDERGNYALGHIVYSRTQKTKREDRYYTFTIEGRDFRPEYGWRVNEEELNRLVEDNRIHVPRARGNLYRKIYKHESKGKPATNLWNDLHSIAMGGESREYPTQKPVSLLERIITMGTDAGDTILDPMAGAGTAGVAAQRLGRSAILIDDNPEAVEIMSRTLS